MFPNSAASNPIVTANQVMCALEAVAADDGESARIQRVQIWQDISEVPGDLAPSVATIGVFDGVHRGHRQLIRDCVNRAAVRKVPSTVVTFWPNPIEIIRPGEPPARICTLTQRLQLIESLGVDSVLILQFSPELSQMSPELFAGSILGDLLHCEGVVVGENFRFGHKARGDVETLTEIGARLGFEVYGQKLTNETVGVPVSSTMIRGLIADGDVAAAGRALVRPHRVEGTVVAGEGRGKDLGFPTANLKHTPFAAIPADGVYAGRLVIDPYGEAIIHSAAISVGSNPTFEDHIERRVEAWAYNAGDIDLYDREVAVDFSARVRDQKKFTDTDQLVDAVHTDVEQIKQILGE